MHAAALLASSRGAHHLCEPILQHVAVGAGRSSVVAFPLQLLARDLVCHALATEAADTGMPWRDVCARQRLALCKHAHAVAGEQQQRQHTLKQWQQRKRAAGPFVRMFLTQASQKAALMTGGVATNLPGGAGGIGPPGPLVNLGTATTFVVLLSEG